MVHQRLNTSYKLELIRRAQSREITLGTIVEVLVELVDVDALESVLISLTEGREFEEETK